jgi:response regulator RpfG family c-di-GMP phosphodiesterase
MSGIKGYEFAQKIKKLKPSVKLFVLTGFEENGSETTKVPSSIKVDGFIKKPPTMSELSQVILFQGQRMSPAVNITKDGDTC